MDFNCCNQLGMTGEEHKASYPSIVVCHYLYFFPRIGKANMLFSNNRHAFVYRTATAIRSLSMFVIH